MLSDELKSIHTALGRLLGKLSPEDADLLRQARRNINNAADDAENLENHFLVAEGN